MRIRHVAALAIALGSLATTSAPARASAPYTVTFTGTATTSGTWAPASPNCGSTPCPGANTWSFTGTGAGAHGVSAGTISISDNGAFNGWCGAATGSGTVTVRGSVNGSGAVGWTKAGATIVLQGALNIGGQSHSLTAVVLVRPISGDCVITRATQFLVAGVGAGA